jgi:hypothetical protein
MTPQTDTPKQEPSKKKSLLLSAAELLTMQFAPEQWIVGNLLRIDSKRMSLLLGQPRDGKSTVAMQLCVSVTQGKPFLGRNTMRAPVIFWQTEAELRKVASSLNRLGYNAANDEKLLILNSCAAENNVTALRRELIAHPDVRLVVIETLDDLLRIPDLNKNTAAREAFDKFDNTVMSEFSHRCAFLALHHLKKRECDREGNMIMGATVISGRTDAVWYIRRKSDDDEQRIFHADVRSGVQIPKTLLNFSKETETNTLGRTVAEERKLGAGKTAETIKKAIVEYFATHANTTFKQDCFPSVDGNSDLKRKMFKELLSSGCLVKTGDGTRNSPFVYRVAVIPMEEQERRAA